MAAPRVVLSRVCEGRDLRPERQRSAHELTDGPVADREGNIEPDVSRSWCQRQDSVEDPLTDTAGPALDVVRQLVTILSLLLGSAVAKHLIHSEERSV